MSQHVSPQNNLTGEVSLHLTHNCKQLVVTSLESNILNFIEKRSAMDIVTVE
ncbi:hypothetical protein SXCC_01413 [Gluconacetobacter sp. SXCC-1]|nr:hypothetical protein SXCC_01413 [Gluconacetobacter sp. SXCC-1]